MERTRSPTNERTNELPTNQPNRTEHERQRTRTSTSRSRKTYGDPGETRTRRHRHARTGDGRAAQQQHEHEHERKRKRKELCRRSSAPPPLLLLRLVVPRRCPGSSALTRKANAALVERSRGSAPRGGCDRRRRVRAARGVTARVGLVSGRATQTQESAYGSCDGGRGSSSDDRSDSRSRSSGHGARSGRTGESAHHHDNRLSFCLSVCQRLSVVLRVARLIALLLLRLRPGRLLVRRRRRQQTRSSERKNPENPYPGGAPE